MDRALRRAYSGFLCLVSGHLPGDPPLGELGAGWPRWAGGGSSPDVGTWRVLVVAWGYLPGDPPLGELGAGWPRWAGVGSGLGWVHRVPCGGGFGPGYPVEVGSQGTLGAGRDEKAPWGWGATWRVMAVGARGGRPGVP